MVTINGKQYKELRCAKCQKFIIYQNIAAGIACYICPRCDNINEFSFKYLKSDENEKVVRKYSLEQKQKNNI